MKYRGKIFIVLLLVGLQIIGLSLTIKKVEAAERIVVRFQCAHLTDPIVSPWKKEMAAEFEKRNPNIKIELESVTFGERRTKFLSAAMAGAAPDVVCLGTAVEVHLYADPGYVISLDQFVEKEGGENFKKRYLDNTIEAATIRGKLYGFPHWCQNYALLYNGYQFKVAGLDPHKPPKTWEELLEYAKKLTRDTDGDGKIDQWGIGICGGKIEFTARWLHVWFWANGADILNQEMTKAILNSPEGVEAFTFWSELYTKHQVVPPGVTATTASSLRDLFAKEKITMRIDGPPAITTIFRVNPQMKERLLVGPIPVRKQPVSLGITSYKCISKDSKNPIAAWEWIKFLGNYENNVKLAKESRLLPVLKEAAKAPEVQGDKYLKGFVDLLPFSRMIPAYPQAGEIENAIINAAQLTLLGQKSPQEALDEAAAEINRILKK